MQQINKLRSSREGFPGNGTSPGYAPVPQQLVSNNGPQFVLDKFAAICKMKGRGGFRGGALGAEAPPLLGYHLKNDVKSGRST